MNRIDLTNRRAVVTGGAQGIGRATVERFLDSGAIVSLWDMDAKELETAAAELKSRGKIHTAVVDVSNHPQVEAAAAATIAAIGGIDILVANAGIAGPNHKLVGLPDPRLAPRHRHQPARRLLLLPRCRPR